MKFSHEHANIFTLNIELYNAIMKAIESMIRRCLILRFCLSRPHLHIVLRIFAGRGCAANIVENRYSAVESAGSSGSGPWR